MFEFSEELDEPLESLIIGSRSRSSMSLPRVYLCTMTIMGSGRGTQKPGIRTLPPWLWLINQRSFSFGPLCLLLSFGLDYIYVALFPKHVSSLYDNELNSYTIQLPKTFLFTQPKRKGSNIGNLTKRNISFFTRFFRGIKRQNPIFYTTFFRCWIPRPHTHLALLVMAIPIHHLARRH